MMNKYENLLNEWCEYLLSMQRDDGGFDCEADEMIHGRADNAIFPLICEYKLTGDERFLSGAEKLLTFRKLFTHDDGAVQNDFSSEWKGITTFSAINLYKTLSNFEDILPPDFKNEIKKRFKASAEWVHKNIVMGFRANINYYAAASTVNAMYGNYYNDKEYAVRSEDLLNYCLQHFTENGLLTGEGQPHNFRTKKGCAPIDIGYNVEESLPCLVDTAKILDNKTALKLLAIHGKILLEFMLPDGGWDNSFGARNNKWTYYGSRTSDGCIAAFYELGKLDPIFFEATERTFDILKKCTSDGKLYGGMFYSENRQPPCVHHTFCHACALADAICSGLSNPQKRQALPCDKNELSFKYYPEIDTYKIHAGKWLATVTGYDFSTYTYARGAAHSSGGTLSFLYRKSCGPVIAGTVYDYKLTEQNNMQLPTGDIKHATLIPRAEYEKYGRKYSTCLDGNAEINIAKTDNKITVTVNSAFVCAEDKTSERENLSAEFIYEFTDDEVDISVSVNEMHDDICFVLPIIKDTVTVLTENKFNKENIFFLTGGFAADEYTFPLSQISERHNKTLRITLKP